MKLKDEYNSAEATVSYVLKNADGQRTRSKMPATVAEEIVQRADKKALCNEGEFGIIVNDEMLFPADVFEFDDADRAAMGKPGEKAGKAEAKAVKPGSDARAKGDAGQDARE